MPVSSRSLNQIPALTSMGPDPRSLLHAQFGTEKPLRQPEKFKEAARELETDDDRERFNERVGKLVRQKPVGRSDHS